MPAPPYPAWRRWASYVTDQTLARGPGDHTDCLEVILRRGKVLLQAEGAVYSWEDNYYNFREAFAYLDWDALAGRKVLLLGLGLGSAIQIAEEHFGQVLDATALEYDAVVADLAQRYLLGRLRSRVRVVVEDAERFVARLPPASKYDLVLVDIFVDDRVPERFETEGFLRALRDVLAHDGCLISNRLSYRATDEEATRRYFEEVFARVFPGAEVLDVRSNWMLFSDVRCLRVPDA